jgi:hypothetical protein
LWLKGAASRLRRGRAVAARCRCTPHRSARALARTTSRCPRRRVSIDRRQRGGRGSAMKNTCTCSPTIRNGPGAARVQRPGVRDVELLIELGEQRRALAARVVPRCLPSGAWTGHTHEPRLLLQGIPGVDSHRQADICCGSAASQPGAARPAAHLAPEIWHIAALAGYDCRQPCASCRSPQRRVSGMTGRFPPY